MPILPILLCLLSVMIASFAAVAQAEPDDALPIVPDGFAVDVIAREPLVRNPCVMAFDRRGRLFIGQGPQWRAPTPDTPGDRVDILIDDDGDGIADRTKTFAHGFNCIQGLAWRGRDLWVANAPDLTIVRDLDGDDEADQYVRVYTGLGNLEHGLHGLNFGPDGKLYMSKGNSKGYNRPDQLAPLAFRKLWGLPSPPGAPDHPPAQVFTKESYRRNYHTPQDDWGRQGGVLRCDPDGSNLEIVASGMRNPWDITFDDGFNWLGTDNDQTQGDKIMAPFFGAHFGWGHAWSYHWSGQGHLPTAPASAPLFEGSGAGVVYYHAKQFPEAQRNLFFVGDWMRRAIYQFRPKMDGALMTCQDGFPPVFAHAGGGRTLPASGGRVFDPTDIEVGPDGALYVLSWGQAYGATMNGDKQTDAGRVYRIRYAGSPLVKWRAEHRSRPVAAWTLDQLFADLGSHIPAWRTDAQVELTRRGDQAQAYLQAKLRTAQLTRAQETWTLWTLGAMAIRRGQTEQLLVSAIGDEQAGLNARRQALRILARRARDAGDAAILPAQAANLLQSDDAVLRFEAVQAVRQARQSAATPSLLNLVATEDDRIVFYAGWQALRALNPPTVRQGWLGDSRPRVRLAALLGLFEDGAADVQAVLAMRADADPQVRELVESWVQKTGAAKPLVVMDPPPGDYAQPIAAGLTTTVPRAVMHVTLDGSVPANTSPRYRGPIAINRDTTLRVAVAQGHAQAGAITTARYCIRHDQPYRSRPFVTAITARSGRAYQMDDAGLRIGAPVYTDRAYQVLSAPPELIAAPLLMTANNDDRSTGDHCLSFQLQAAATVLVGVDTRVDQPLTWMRIGEPDGFADTGKQVQTHDAHFRLYAKAFDPGVVTLGGNTNHPARDSRRGHYIVILNRDLLKPRPDAKPVTLEQVMQALPDADPARGRDLFLHPRGAGCYQCHRMQGRGNVFAPDLADIGYRGTPQALIESILKPSQVITEGFSQQIIETKQGDTFAGVILEESALHISLAQANGQARRIAKADILQRRVTKRSAMPDGFDKLLSPQQIADIVAWLQLQKRTGDPQGFSFQQSSDQLDIYFGKQRIATYLMSHPKLTRRALVNVTTLTGVQVTRNFPPRVPDDIDPGYPHEHGVIHPVMHPGIWLGFGDVSGHDYWRLQANARFDQFVEPPTGDRKTGRFTARNHLMNQDGQQVVCTETTSYQFRQTPLGLLLLMDATYLSQDHDFYFGDQEESGLAVRVASPIRVQGGAGAIINDRGERNGAQVWGKPAKWFDYAGVIDGKRVGLMVAPHPDNPRPSWLHARDYGVAVTNPFPKQPRERREPYVKTWVRKGETFQLRYAVLIHESPETTPLDHSRAYQLILKGWAD